MIRDRLIVVLRGTPPSTGAPAPEPVVPPPHALDPDGVKAFAEHARWVYALHDKRSDVFGQRAATILAFDGALLSLLVAGLVAVKKNVEFTDGVVVNVVVLAVLPVLSAFACLLAMSPRKVVIPKNAEMREHWATFRRSDSKLHVPAQVVHSFLGGDQDPLASVAKEAKSRGAWFEGALVLLITAVLALGVLAVQLLRQLT